MTAIDHTAFARLESEGRLLNPVLKGPTHKPGRFGFRGELALKFTPSTAGEKRPPELAVDQVISTTREGEPTIALFAAYLLSFDYAGVLADVLGETLSPEGKYFLFCNNIPLDRKFRLALGGATFHIVPIDEATVYNELLELLKIDKTDLKKLDTAGKQDFVADKAARFSASWPFLTYEEALAIMGPVRNPGENRPV
ncbi:hypothetical protein [Aquabacter cavernae]|uniref:hypothetical protein n=1 Tax=Aquabacter cavernae TaxID=2496029 RepID=UPI000F8C979C|nr:hypothetical protein [Aquabacter cavernae]